MLLNRPVTGLTDTPAKLAMLKYVLVRGFNMTGRELARISGVSHTSVNRVMREFESAGLVSWRRAGTAIMWRSNHESYAFAALEPLYGRVSVPPVEELKKEIISYLPRNGIIRVILFGSVAEKREKEGSDIDLFILVDDKKAAEKTEKELKEFGFLCIKKYGNALTPYILTQKEYAQKKNLALIKNIEKGVRLV